MILIDLDSLYQNKLNIGKLNVKELGDACKSLFIFSRFLHAELQISKRNFPDIYKVIIVGAGPSGLVLSLLLSKANITVTLLDSESTIDDRPRAAHYAPSAIQVLSRAGVLEDVRRDGLIPMNMTWRKKSGDKIAGIPKVSQPWNKDAMTVLPLNMLGKVLLEHVEKDNKIEVRWNWKVTSVGSDEKKGKAWVVAEVGREGEKREEKLEADYVCGCDGANSIVRRTLFGSDFPGKTWDAQIVATNVSHSPPLSIENYTADK